MRARRGILRWVAIAAAVLLFAAACGDDSDGDAAPGDDNGSDAGDPPADDPPADDSSADDPPADDPPADDPPADDPPAAPAVAEFENCEDFRDALAEINTTGGSDSSGEPDELRADFENSRQAIAAMKATLPDDLKGEADKLLAGVNVIDAAFGEIDYDMSRLASGEGGALLEIYASQDVVDMAAAAQNIQQWVLAGCA